MTTQIVIKEITPLAENTTVTVAEGLNLVQRFNSLVDTPSSYTGQQGKHVKVDQSESGLEFSDPTFAEQVDTPSSYTGQQGKHVRVKQSEEGLEFVEPTLAEMTDTPNNYAGSGGYDVRVKSDESGIEFYEPEHWKQYVRGEAEMRQMRNQNNDARAASGFDHYGVHVGGASINEGLWVNQSTGSENLLYMGRAMGASFAGTSKTPYPVSCIAGFVSELLNVGVSDNINNTLIKFSDAPDGTVTYDTTTGIIVQHPNAATAFASETATNKVVIDRHDMFGGEFFLEEVSTSNPFVYHHGMIQSQSTTMNGITTTTSNRPTSYYAVYEGDVSSNGRGVDFGTAADQQKIDMVSDESNNIFVLNDGRLVQWRMRQRTIAGVGNGNWFNLSPNISLLAKFDPNYREYLHPQGIKDNVTPTSNDYVGLGYYPNPPITFNPLHHAPISIHGASTDGSSFGGFDGDVQFAVDGECYFHVWGVVRRLNRGVYHPSFNPLGTAKATDGFWHQSTVLNSTEDCFIYVDSSTGSVSSGISGRVDGRFYDGIYKGGDGGVNDHRLSAWDMSSKEEASKVFQNVVNGTYRGEENLKFTRVFSSVGVVPLGWTIQNQDNPSAVVAYTNSGASVSGEFQMIDVIGNPSEIMLEPDLVDGWQGGWISAIPDGTQQKFFLTRKQLEDQAGFDANQVTYKNTRATAWQQITWSSFSGTGSVSENLFTNSALSATNVSVLYYTAFAKQTVEANNTPVLNGIEGIGDVLATCDHNTYQGGVFAESIMGKVLTSSGTNKPYNTLAKVDIHIDANTGILPTWFNHEHMPINMPAPINDSPAVKALWYQVTNNQQISLNFAWNELVYNSGGAAGNEWGDTTAATTYSNATGTINITSGTGTYTNKNGDVCLRGSATLSKPYGYTRNQARAGTQTDGVDL